MIEVSWWHSTKQHYLDKGYQFTKYGDKFLVKAEDLSKYADKKVKVICDYCGKEYEMAWSHYNNDVLCKGSMCACYNCRHKKMYANNLSKRQESLYNKAVSVCAKKGYILKSDKTDIKNNITYVKYLCAKHGEKTMRISNLISGKGCPECVLEKHNMDYRLSSDEVERRITSLGSVLLNKEDYINSSIKNLKIVCNECGNIFITSLARFSCHKGQVCQECSKKESKGERYIRHYLDNKGINFTQEKIFPNCKDQRYLPFDFYLPDFNLCIEFDGSQHYYDKGNFSTSLQYTQRHDEIKNRYCKEHNIDLLRIPYYKYDKISNILDNKLFT